MTTFKILPQTTTDTDIGVGYAANELEVEESATPSFSFDPAPEYTVAVLKRWPMGDGVPGSHNVYFTYYDYETHNVQLDPYSSSWEPYEVTGTLLDDTLAIYSRDMDRELYAVYSGDPGSIQTEPHLVPSGTIDVRIWGNVGSDPDINGDWTATVIDTITVSIPVEIITGGEGGTVTFKDVPMEDIPLNLDEVDATSDECGFQGLVDGDYTAVVTWPDIESFWGHHKGGETETEFTMAGTNVVKTINVPNTFDATAIGKHFTAADLATAGGYVDMSLWYRATPDPPVAGSPPNDGGTGWTLLATRRLTKEMHVDQIECTDGDLPDGLSYWYKADSPAPPPHTYLDVCCTWEYGGEHRYCGIGRVTTGGENVDWTYHGVVGLTLKYWDYD